MLRHDLRTCRLHAFALQFNEYKHMFGHLAQVSVRLISVDMMCKDPSSIPREAEKHELILHPRSVGFQDVKGEVIDHMYEERSPHKSQHVVCVL